MEIFTSTETMVYRELLEDTKGVQGATSLYRRTKH